MENTKPFYMWSDKEIIKCFSKICLDNRIKSEEELITWMESNPEDVIKRFCLGDNEDYDLFINHLKGEFYEKSFLNELFNNFKLN